MNARLTANPQSRLALAPSSRLLSPVTLRLLALWLLFLLSNAAQAQYTTAPDGSGGVIITGYAGAGGNISIPATIGGQTVTGIGDYAFYNCSSLTGVTMGGNITSIGDFVFAYDSSLTQLTIGNAVASIGEWAFLGCGFTTITIPASVSFIGDNVFSDCPSLTAITVDGGNAYYSNHNGDGVLYDKSQTTLIQYPTGDAFHHSFTIPSGVTTIGLQAFNNSILSSVTFPDSVTTIGESAFYGCGNLTNVAINDATTHLTSIGDYAFYYCPALTSFIIPVSVTTIGSQAFGSCQNLAGIHIPAGVTSIGSGPFAGCTTLTAITVDAGNPDYTDNGDGVLYDKGLTTLIQYPAGDPGTGLSFAIPSGVTSIGDSAFAGADLTSVTIPTSVTSIGFQAFFNCDLVSVAIPDSVTSMGDQAFELCYSLADISIGTGLASIGEQEFYSCGALGSIIIPANVTSMGSQAFAYCWNLSGAYFLGAPPTNDGSAFAGETNAIAYYLAANAAGWAGTPTYGGINTALWAIPFTFSTGGGVATITGYVGSGGAVAIPKTITDGSGNTYPVTSIGGYAFAGNTTITSVDISSSVTTLGGGAFANCPNLVGVYFDGTPPGDGMDNSVFAGDGGTMAYYLPLNSWAWPTAFDGIPAVENPFIYTSDGTTITITGYNGTPPSMLVIPSIIDGLPVTIIGNDAFSTELALTGIVIPDSVTTIGDYAFYDCSGLAGVTIPDSVTSIGSSTFAFCISMSSLTLGSHVNSIGDMAFDLCSNLRVVNIPASVTSIGSGAFSFCPNMVEAFFLGNAPAPGTAEDVFAGDSTNAYYLSVNAGSWGASYGGIPTVELFYPYFTFQSDGAGGLTITGSLAIPPSTLVIPGSINGLPVTGIADNAFSGDTTITSVTIPDSVISIGNNSFYGCTKIANITFGANLATIGNQAFADCTSLTAISIPSSVNTIGSDAFANCGPALAYAIFASTPPAADGTVFAGDPDMVVYYQNPVGWGTTYGGAPVEAFPYTYQSDGVSITITGYTGSSNTITIPSTINGLPVTGIGQFAFQGLNLISAVIPDGVSYIGGFAFAYCNSLTSITIPPSVTDIGSNAFINCYNLASVNIPGNAISGTTIEGYAFYSCNAMTSLTLGTGVTTIGDYAFCYASNLTSLNIPASVTSIGEGAFQGSYSLTAFLVDPGNPNYSNNADGVLFNKNQTTLVAYPGAHGSSYTIPTGVTSIGATAFAVCFLTNVAIPNTVASIGDFSFGATYLTSVTIPASVTSIEGDSFGQCSELTSITVDAANPDYSSTGGVLFDKGQTTLIQYPGGLTGTYSIPSGVTSIGGYSFEECKLTSVTIPDSVTSIGNGAFSYSLNLDSVPFGASPGITSIGEDAFFYCPQLTSVTIPASVASVGQGAFYYCSDLTTAIFAGNAPTMGSNVFGQNAAGFDVEYYNGATGFTTPTWDGYPTLEEAVVGGVTSWLTAHGIPATANLSTPVASLGGTSLLMAYALGLNPNAPLGGANQLPAAVVAGGVMSYTYYSISPGITYTVEASADLINWTTAGITITGPNGSGYSTATVPLASGLKYFKLIVGQ